MTRYLFLQQFSSRSNSPFSNFYRQQLINFVALLKSLLLLGSSVKSLKTSYCRLNVAPLGKRMHPFSSFDIPHSLVYSWIFLILVILSLSLLYFQTDTYLILQVHFFYFCCILSGNNQSIVKSSLLAVTSELHILQKERILSSKATARRLTEH